MKLVVRKNNLAGQMLYNIHYPPQKGTNETAPVPSQVHQTTSAYTYSHQLILIAPFSRKKFFPDFKSSRTLKLAKN